MCRFLLNPVVATTICTLLLGLFVVAMKWGLSSFVEGYGVVAGGVASVAIFCTCLLIAFRVDAADKRRRGAPKP